MGLVTSYAGLTKKREKVEAKKCFEKQSGNDPLIRGRQKKNINEWEKIQDFVKVQNVSHRKKNIHGYAKYDQKGKNEKVLKKKKKAEGANH